MTTVDQDDNQRLYFVAVGGRPGPIECFTDREEACSRAVELSLHNTLKVNVVAVEAAAVTDFEEELRIRRIHYRRYL